jgi:hypothetical protein
MAHLTKTTGDPIGDAVLAYRQFYTSTADTPFDIMVNTADYSAWAYHHNRLTSDQQREALGYYSRLWGNSGLSYESVRGVNDD